MTSLAQVVSLLSAVRAHRDAGIVRLWQFSDGQWAVAEHLAYEPRAPGYGHVWLSELNSPADIRRAAIELLKAAAEDEQAARQAAVAFETRYPTVAKDVTVRLTPHGWVAFDWVSRTRLYPR